MKKSLFIIISSLVVSSANAAVPYCAETTPPPPLEDHALQTVVAEYAQQHGCEVGNNCLLNFDQFKYSVAWKRSCAAGSGSTFICQNHVCHPYGFSDPRARY